MTRMNDGCKLFCHFWNYICKSRVVLAGNGSKCLYYIVLKLYQRRFEDWARQNILGRVRVHGTGKIMILMECDLELGYEGSK
jgi:hypothetical protein